MFLDSFLRGQRRSDVCCELALFSSVYVNNVPVLEQHQLQVLAVLTLKAVYEGGGGLV